MKTSLLLSVILSVFFIFDTGKIVAGNEGIPLKPGNKLVCSDCGLLETGTRKVALSDGGMVSMVPKFDLSGLLPVIPKEVSLEDETGSCDTLLLNKFKPAVPSEAGFNDDDPVMTFTLKHLSPKTPLRAGFEDLK